MASCGSTNAIPQGLIDGKALGQQSRLNDQRRAALAQAIERGPTPNLYGVVRWRLCDLAQWLWEEFRVSESEQTLGREVRTMRYRKLAAGPKLESQPWRIRSIGHRMGQ